MAAKWIETLTGSLEQKRQYKHDKARIDGRVGEVHIDADRDGRVDRWQKWEGGRLVQEDLDTDGDGRGDRRLRYDARGKLLGMEPVAAR